MFMFLLNTAPTFNGNAKHTTTVKMWERPTTVKMWERPTTVKMWERQKVGQILVAGKRRRFLQIPCQLLATYCNLFRYGNRNIRIERQSKVFNILSNRLREVPSFFDNLPTFKMKALISRFQEQRLTFVEMSSFSSF